MIYSLINLKGGVGKTTTALNISAGLHKKGRKVLLIDLDGQCNATYQLLEDKKEYSICDVINDINNLDKAIYQTNYGFDIIPASFELFRLESLTVQNVEEPYYKKIKKIILKLKDRYDDIVIDNNPRLEAWAINSIFASYPNGQVIIPIKIDKYALDGFKEVMNKIEKINDNYEIDVKWKIIITMKTKTKINNEIIETLKSQLNENQIFDTTIRYQSNPVTLSTFNKTLLVDDLKNGLGKDYRDFVDELMKG